MEARASAPLVAFFWFLALGTYLVTRIAQPKHEPSWSDTLVLAPSGEPDAAPLAEAKPAPLARVYGLVSNVAATVRTPAPAHAASSDTPAASDQAAAPAPALAPPPSAGPARDRWEWAYLWTRPAEYLVKRTWLGSPELLSRKLSNPENIENYLSMPLVRATLGSPSAVKLLAGNHALVGAFLGSPAMQNPETVRRLLDSPLISRILASPGVKEWAKDPAAMRHAVESPELAGWFSANPGAASLLIQAGNGQGPRRKG